MFSFLTAPKLLITALIASVFTVAVIQTNYQHAMVGNYYVDPYFACQQIISPLTVTSELKDRKVGECLFDICLRTGGNITTAEMKNVTDECVLKAGGIAAIKARAGCAGAGETCEQRATATAFCKIYVPMRDGNGVEDEFLGCGLIGDQKDCLQCCDAQNQDDAEGLKTCYERSCNAAPPSEASDEFNNCANCVVQLMVQGGIISGWEVESCMQGLGGGGPEAICGDGICDGENPGTCPSDCTEPGPTCGDGICDFDEDEDSCPADCGFNDDGGEFPGDDPSGGFDESTGGFDPSGGDINDDFANLEQGDDWGNLEQGDDQGNECPTPAECKARFYSCLGTPPNPAKQEKCAKEFEACMACQDPSGGDDWGDGGDLPGDDVNSGGDDFDESVCGDDICSFDEDEDFCPEDCGFDGDDISDVDSGGNLGGVQGGTQGGAQGGGGGKSCEQKCKDGFYACYESTGDSETCGDAYQSCIERCSNMDGGDDGGGNDTGDSCELPPNPNCKEECYFRNGCQTGLDYEVCTRLNCGLGDGGDDGGGNDTGDSCELPPNPTCKDECYVQNECQTGLDYEVCTRLNCGLGDGGGFDTGDIFGEDQGTVGGAFGGEGTVGDGGNIFGDADEGGIGFEVFGDNGFEGDISDNFDTGDGAVFGAESGFGEAFGDLGNNGFGDEGGEDIFGVGFGVEPIKEAGVAGGNNGGQDGFFGDLPDEEAGVGKSPGVQSVYQSVSSAMNNLFEGVTSTVGGFFRGLFGGN